MTIPKPALGRFSRLRIGLGLAWAVVAIAKAGFPAGAPLVTASHTMVIRLLTPIASYSPAGTRFDARVIGPELRRGFNFLPSDTIITGKVEKSATVRFGLRRERALLQLEFDGCRLPDGIPVECKVALQDVDNARETVRGNRIDGVLAAGRPASWLSGLWYRPAASLFSNSVIGLTGFAGTVYTQLSPTPIGAVAVVGTRLLFDRLPDPEIDFPAGTDLLVRIDVPDDLTRAPEALTPVPPMLSEWVKAQPEDVYLPDKKLAGDAIHLVFVGSRDQVESAFLAAGWTIPDPLTRHSFARMYASFLELRADPTAPIAPLRYRGNTSTLSFQKTLNTVAKRHHIRIWPASFEGSQVWLAAATHDTSIAFEARRLSLTHRIDPVIDRERTTVVNDLVSAGCVAQFGFVDRPRAVRLPGNRKPSITDGDAVVLFLQDCSATQYADSDLQEPRHNRASLFLRHFFLENRQYLTRGNVYYWVYRGGVALVRKMASSPAVSDRSASGG